MVQPPCTTRRGSQRDRRPAASTAELGKLLDEISGECSKAGLRAS
jgi:hypothetical protein